MGLFFPRKMSATCAATRPRTAPLASITCHLRWSRFTLGKCVFISNPDQRKRENTKELTQVNSFWQFFGNGSVMPGIYCCRRSAGLRPGVFATVWTVPGPRPALRHDITDPLPHLVLLC